MTAHTPITGTRVLVAPAQIRGKVGYTQPEWVQKHRLAWIKSLPKGTARKEVAEALCISRDRAGRLMKQAALHRAPGRGDYWNRGMLAGSVRKAILSMPPVCQDALEAHCALSGQTMADALADLWMTVHAERGQA